MDPISALIGAGSSLIGGLMNTSSAQAINSANIQQAQWSAEGGYLPGLIANANKAGINPLVAMGVKSPGFAGLSPTNPGAGVSAAGANLSQNVLHTQKMQKTAEEQADTQLSQSKIDLAMNQEAQRRIQRNPNLFPSSWQDTGVVNPAVRGLWNDPTLDFQLGGKGGAGGQGTSNAPHSWLINPHPGLGFPGVYW